MFDSQSEFLRDGAKSFFEISEWKERYLGDKNKGANLRKVTKIFGELQLSCSLSYFTLLATILIFFHFFTNKRRFSEMVK